MTVYAFDIDGTLETSGGPVKTSMLLSLQRRVHRLGSYVYLVSPSMARPPGFPVVLVGTRHENLEHIKALHPDEEDFVYVSDNKDHGEAELAGFLFVDAEDFERFFAEEDEA